MIGLAVLGGLYVCWRPQGPRRQHRQLCRALAVLFLALNGPLHNLSDTYLFSAHMAQHLLLTLVFPPLLLYGTPASIVRPLLRPRWTMALGRFVTRPLAAATLFTAPIVLWHVPAWYEAALRHHNLHIVQHLVFLTTAVIMWWPVLSPMPGSAPAASAANAVSVPAGHPDVDYGCIDHAFGSGLYPFYAQRRPRESEVVTARRSTNRRSAHVGARRGLMLWIVMTVIWFRYSVWDERGDAKQGYRWKPMETRNSERETRNRRTDGHSRSSFRVPRCFAVFGLPMGARRSSSPIRGCSRQR